MKVEWTEPAFKNLEGIYQYISLDSPYHAKSFSNNLFKATEKLEVFPRMGKVVPEAEDYDEEIRELIYQSYRIIYQVEEDKGSVYILSVIHGSKEPRV